MGAHRGFIQGAPDFAIEVRSPEDRLRALVAKARDYLAAGGRLVWIVDPATRRVYVHRRGRLPRVVQGRAVLDGGDVLPRFSLPLADVFADLE
jgi:Uma2 family endonuclease